MFDIGWGELVLIGVVALIVIGPKELPGALRTLGQWMTKLRRMASEFQNQFHEAMREAEMADLKKQEDADDGVEQVLRGEDGREAVHEQSEVVHQSTPSRIPAGRMTP